MSTYTINTVDGWTHVRTPYNEEFVASLKREIPYSIRGEKQRLWVADSREWRVREAWTAFVRRLCRACFPNATESPVFAAGSAPSAYQNITRVVRTANQAPVVEQLRSTVSTLQSQLSRAQRERATLRRNVEDGQALRREIRRLQDELARAARRNRTSVGDIDIAVGNSRVAPTPSLAEQVRELNASRARAAQAPATVEKVEAPTAVLTRWETLDCEEAKINRERDIAVSPRFAGLDWDNDSN